MPDLRALNGHSASGGGLFTRSDLAADPFLLNDRLRYVTQRIMVECTPPMCPVMLNEIAVLKREEGITCPGPIPSERN